MIKSKFVFVFAVLCPLVLSVNGCGRGDSAVIDGEEVTEKDAREDYARTRSTLANAIKGETHSSGDGDEVKSAMGRLLQDLAKNIVALEKWREEKIEEVDLDTVLDAKNFASAQSLKSAIARLDTFDKTQEEWLRRKKEMLKGLVNRINPSIESEARLKNTFDLLDDNVAAGLRMTKEMRRYLHFGLLKRPVLSADKQNTLWNEPDLRVARGMIGRINSAVQILSRKEDAMSAQSAYALKKLDELFESEG